MVSKFFQRVARHFANEAALVTPNGRLLSHSLEEGLEKWRALPEADRKRLDDLGAYDAALDPLPPDGGLILKVFARGIERDPSGAFRPYRTEVARSFEPGRDHLWLTGAEWRSLIPLEPLPGATVPAPDAVIDRICRRALIDLVRVGGNGGPRKPEEVLSRELTSRVEKVEPATLLLRLEGKARLATHDVGSGAQKEKPKIDEFAILGYIAVDRSKGQITRFDLVAFSETGHFDEIHGKTVPFGVALELTAGREPADRARPSSFSKDYYGARVRSF